MKKSSKQTIILTIVCLLGFGIYVWFSSGDGLAFFKPFTNTQQIDNSSYWVYSQVTKDNNNNNQNKTIDFIDPKTFKVVKSITTDIDLPNPTYTDLNFNKTKLLLPPSPDGIISVVDLTDGKTHAIAQVKPGTKKVGGQHSWEITSYHWVGNNNQIELVTQETKTPDFCLEKLSIFNDSGSCYAEIVKFTKTDLDLDKGTRKSSKTDGPGPKLSQSDSKPTIPNSENSSGFFASCNNSSPCYFYSR